MTTAKPSTETSAIFYRSATEFTMLQIGIAFLQDKTPVSVTQEELEGIHLGVLSVTSNPRTWPQHRGLYVMYFWRPENKEKWFQMSGQRLDIHQLAQFQDGTWPTYTLAADTQVG